MKKITNKTHYEGYLFSHSLEAKVTGPDSKNPGTEYIRGRLNIATDAEGMNVVPINFSYVTARTKAGKENPTYKVLMTIINSENKTFDTAGTDAYMLKIDSAIGVNDFYNAEDELVTIKQNDGGFVHIVNKVDFNNANSFEADMLITNTIFKEADEDRNEGDVLTLKGCTFNFMGSLIPVDFAVRTPEGIKYFESLDISTSNPVFIKVWGEVVSTTIEAQTFEESAFGESSVKITTRSFREWLISGAATQSYEFGDEAVLTAEEVSAAVAARETYLAGQKAQHDAYIASRAATSTPASNMAAVAPSAAPGEFKF